MDRPAPDAASIDDLLARATAKAQAGKLDAAVSLVRKILAIDPRHFDAHHFLAGDAMRRQDFANAVRHAEHSVDLRPEVVELHRELADAHLALLKKPDAEKKLAEIVEDVPFAYASLLHLSRLREMRGDGRAALIGYTRALHTAELRGFWHAEAATPPWLRAAVGHARKVAVEGRIALFHDWFRPMQQRFGAREMRRVGESLEMYLDLKPTTYADPRQQPTFLYFPGLPIAPVFDRAALPFAEWYEAEAPRILEEALHVLHTADDIAPFHYDVPEDKRHALTAGGSWDAYFFFEEGDRLAAHHDACPHTSSVLARLPLDHVRQHGPEVCFSIMRPGAHILPHRGVTNTRSVLHLGLDIPPGCALNLVEVQEVGWEPGRCFAFDDTYLHEAWNKSDRTRIVLLGDIWNPYLTEPERIAVADLVGVIGDFNRATDAVPPPVA